LRRWAIANRIEIHRINLLTDLNLDCGGYLYLIVFPPGSETSNILPHGRDLLGKSYKELKDAIQAIRDNLRKAVRDNFIAFLEDDINHSAFFKTDDVIAKMNEAREKAKLEKRNEIEAALSVLPDLLQATSRGNYLELFLHGLFATKRKIGTRITHGNPHAMASDTYKNRGEGVGYGKVAFEINEQLVRYFKDELKLNFGALDPQMFKGMNKVTAKLLKQLDAHKKVAPVELTKKEEKGLTGMTRNDIKKYYEKQLNKIEERKAAFTDGKIPDIGDVPYFTAMVEGLGFYMMKEKFDTDELTGEYTKKDEYSVASILNSEEVFVTTPDEEGNLPKIAKHAFVYAVNEMIEELPY
jgi:hypothetical protein